MNLLMNESPLQILPSLAMKVGLNEALLLQQLHFKSLISRNIRDGYKWVYQTYEEWKNEEFPFWSVDTIKRTIRRLEKQGVIISTDSYNRMKMDKTKWYRIDYSALQLQMTHIASSTVARCKEEDQLNAPSNEVEFPPTRSKEFKDIKKEYVGSHLDVVSVVEYLNEKADKQFKAKSKATVRLVNARFQEGYKFKDFKNVIDSKVKEWGKDEHWNKYLRPSTLFNGINFENYLEEYRFGSNCQGSPQLHSPQPFELDFSKGES